MEQESQLRTRVWIAWIVALGAPACALDAVAISSTEQASTQLWPLQQQGRELQGMQLQGMQLQSMTMQGFQFAGASLGGTPLVNLRVENGELVAEQDQVTLRGAALVGAHLYAQVGDAEADSSPMALVEYRIIDIAEEDPKYDPTDTASTFLYALEQNVDNFGVWQPACRPDLDGRGVAIPVAATWNAHGDRVESSSLFTLGCTTGVIAKCYRWGYRPWVTGYGDLAAMHWACTRLARADYCGDGVPHTEDGTWINLWDDLPPPGPIQQHGASTPDGMHFEAAWNTDGAECVSRTRWQADMPLINKTCPGRHMSDGDAKKFCDTVDDARSHGLTVLLFNESFDDPLHPKLPQPPGDGSAPSGPVYIKASDTAANDTFGFSVALSADGSTLAVGSPQAGENSVGASTGAVYVFTRSGPAWVQQALVKASNPDINDQFGFSVALSADNSVSSSGAIYVFTRAGPAWGQQAYVKASNTGPGDEFGWSIALSNDGSTLAVGAREEASAATGINGNQADNSAPGAGAAYRLKRSGMTWSQQAYVKASNTGLHDELGTSVALSGDGSTLAAGATGEASDAIGIGGSQVNHSAARAGAVYLFR